MRSRIAFLLIFFGITGGIIPIPVQTQGVIKEIFVSQPFEPSDFSSFNVDATVFGEGLSGCHVVDDPPNDYSSRAYTTGAPGVISMYAIGWGEKEGNEFTFFTGAANGSADAWTEIHFTDPKGIPAEIGPEQIDSVGIRIKGKIRKTDGTLALCGASWTQAFGYMNINGLDGNLSFFRIGGHPPDPSFDFDPCIPGSQAAKGIAKAMEAIPKVINAAGKLLNALNAIQVSFGPEEDFEAFFMLPVSIEPEELRQKLLDNQPLDINIQFGFRSSAVLGAVAETSGTIRIDEVEVVGLGVIEPVVYLEIWHYYHQEQLLVKRLTKTQEYNIKQKLYYNIGEYPEVMITCPIPYPMAPGRRMQGRLYSIIGDNLWRLDYIMLDDNERLRSAVEGDSCSYGPIVMNHSHKLIFGFERAVADLVVESIRTDPPLQYLQQGSEFELNVLVRNTRELSTLQACRSVPLTGDYKLFIKVEGEELMLDETRLEAAGDPLQEDAKELFAGSWVAPQEPSMTIQVTVDAEDNVDEGIKGEINNTMTITIPLAYRVPDLSFKDPADLGFTLVSPSIFRLNATVTNLSPVATSQVAVRFTAIPAGQEWGETIGEKVIPSLAGNSSERVELDWDTSKEAPGDYTILVEIDPENKIQEGKETNNTAFFNVTVTPTPPAQQCGRLETTMKDYQQGNPVTIIFINDCQAPVNLPNSVPWIVKDSQGRIVFSPVALQVITEVPPGGEENWTWDQKDSTQQQVPPGTYTIELKTMDRTLIVSFNIVVEEAGFAIWLLLFFFVVVSFWRLKRSRAHGNTSDLP